jgi:DNA-binding transcriptional LysR family regulator
VRVEGQLVFNNIALRLNAALAGLGLPYLPEDQVQTHLAEGRLIRLLADWYQPFSGYHLFYPSRRQPLPEPSTTEAGLCLVGRCAALPRRIRL